MKINKLKTNYIVGDIPLNEYPRPNFVRDYWVNLNGYWEFEIDKSIKIPTRFSKKILVPFPIESQLSGLEYISNKYCVYHYRKKFSIQSEKRILLHIGAVDQTCLVYINNELVCSNEGGYYHIDVDITQYVDNENILDITVIDNLEKKYPYGKQTKKRGGMWYTKVSGIWQTVWLEEVPEDYIEKYKIETKGDNVTIHIPSNTKVIFNNEEYTSQNEVCTFTVDDPEYWSPENPKLYYFKMKYYDDEVTSYFALRDLTIEKVGEVNRLCLNGKPYFFNGLLDQGYFPDGLFTPPSYDAYKDDILKAKELGFNMLRKHIKIEPDYFYYLADSLGIVIFQDIVNNGGYSFVIDTVIPTFISKKLKDKYKNNNKENRSNFVKFLKKEVNQLYNFPSICYYTIFNEGWGQFSADEMYDKLKTLDSTRFVDSTSGWFKQTKSDVKSDHVYFKKIEIEKIEKPTVISEFGGYVYKDNEHSHNLSKTYGYRIEKSREEFVKDFSRLYLEEIIPYKEKGLSGCVYTQLTDVEDETNGLITYDRKVCKISRDEIKEIIDKLKE